MSDFTINNIFNDRQSLAESIKKNTEKLKKDSELLRKMDAVIESLYYLYPELKEKHLIALNGDNEANGNNLDGVKFPKDGAGRDIIPGVPQWDISLPFRTRIKNLLRSIGRYSKVSEMAEIALKYE